MLTIACVEAGNYLGRGQQYVFNLKSAIARSLPDLPKRFVCFTDGMAGIGSATRGGMPIEYRPLPVAGLRGWMNKLALFKPGVFEDGERVLYLDLDTVIAGPLHDIASYGGDLALLEDVIFAGNRLGSGIMAWRGGYAPWLWATYAAAGYPPDVDGGDQMWIEHALSQQNGGRCDRLQDLYPLQIQSYKVSGGMLAPQTRIVCFHGQPRPHEIEKGWVTKLWGTPPWE